MRRGNDSNRVLDAVLAEGMAHVRNQWKYAGFRIAAFDCPHMPFDPFVVKRFREEIDPSFIPLWLRHVWISPAGTEQFFDYHVLSFAAEAMLEPDEKGNLPQPHRDFRGVLFPYRGETRRPHSYIEILHTKSKTLPKKFLGLPRPLSMSDFHKYREVTYWNNLADRKQRAKEQSEFEDEQIRKVDAYWQAESDYRWDHDWRHMSKLMEGLDVTDRQLLARRVGGNMQRFNPIGHRLPGQ